MEITLLVFFVIVSVMLAILLKSNSPIFSTVISISICIFIMLFAIGQVRKMSEGIREIFRYVKVDKIYLILLLKLVGIAYVSEFGSGICKDAGYSAVASQIEIVGKLTMLLVSLPILMQVVDTIIKMI
ncbi:MAG: SpoIIIAC/SpoIIIAD family protein [Lachnospiraceae bacterium]|nr:SpoIIIAC/SpoIIIAD family protein [Lachnospiraceae bacterium]